MPKELSYRIRDTGELIAIMKGCKKNFEGRKGSLEVTQGLYKSAREEYTQKGGTQEYLNILGLPEELK